MPMAPTTRGGYGSCGSARLEQVRLLDYEIGLKLYERVRQGSKLAAVEPQPECAMVIRAIHGADPEVTLVEAASHARA